MQPVIEERVTGQKKLGLVGAGFLFLLVVGAQLIAGSLLAGLVILVKALVEGGFDNLNIETLLNQSPLVLVAMIAGTQASFVFIGLYLKKEYLPGRRLLGSVDWLLVLLVVLLIVPFGVISSELENFFAHFFTRPDAAMEPIVQMAKSPGVMGLLLAISTISILPALCEEFLFRGMLQNSLLKKFRSSWAITITSLMFAVMHLNITALLPIFLLSLVLGYLLHKTQNLVYPVLLHFANNLLAVLVIRYDGLGVTGLDTSTMQVEHIELHWLLAAIVVATLLLYLVYRRVQSGPSQGSVAGLPQSPA